MKIQKIIFKSQEDAALETEELPDEPLAADEIAGRTLASAISPGTELAACRGLVNGVKYPRGAGGYAAVFEVNQVGSDVVHFKVGDRVFCMGGHQSFQRVKEAGAVRVPAALDAERAIFARFMGITMSTLVTTTARPPSRVLVTGLGLVGHLAAQIFQCAGYDVVACDPAESRRELAMKSGVKNVYSSVPVEDPSIAGKVTLCVECSGYEQAVLDACKVVGPRGEVVMVGVPWARRTDLFAHDVLHAVFHRYVILRSGWEWEVPYQPTDFRNGSMIENFTGAMRWIAEGKIHLGGIYAKHRPQDAQEAYEKLIHMRDGFLTVVFDWTAS